jgi:hypothetical protein
MSGCPTHVAGGTVSVIVLVTLMFSMKWRFGKEKRETKNWNVGGGSEKDG